MRIAYLYNEKLPKRTAHDVYVWRNVYFLSHGLQEASPQVSCLTGLSQPRHSLETLQKHYLPKEHHFQESSDKIFCEDRLPFWSTFLDASRSQIHQMGRLQWIEFPLMRKSGPLRMSWNLPFFYRCQKWIESKVPDWTLMSVYKQADFHLARKVPGTRYLFEVHDLAFYPQAQEPKPDAITLKAIERQKRVLNACDAVTVTTESLKIALEQAPYHIQTPIYIVPLASEMNPVIFPQSNDGQITLGYVGQLYREQGVDELIQALAGTSNIRLEIMGGNARDLERLKHLVYSLKLDSRVHFHGFVSPQALSSRIYGCHGLVAPFHPNPHMRHVAHTKLVDYGRWGLPVIAPKLEITREEVRSEHFLFDAAHYPLSIDSLTATLQKFSEGNERAIARSEVEEDIKKNPQRFSWFERTQKLHHILSK